MAERPKTAASLACHPYHRVYVGGGKMDGHITHLFAPDFPKTTGSACWDGTGQRSYYVREDAAPGSTVGVYLHTGDGTKQSRACRSCRGTGDADNTTEIGRGPLCQPCGGTGYAQAGRSSLAGDERG